MWEQIRKNLDVLDVQTLLTQFVFYLPKLIAGFIILIIFFFLYRLIRFIVTRTLQRASVSISIIELVEKSIKYIVFGLAIILVVDQLGIRIIAIISTLGVAGIAVGLAAQQTLANVISGIIILVNKPFREGDYVELEGTFGKIEKISLRSTMMVTLDNILVDLPNQKIIESKIINHTYYRNIRLRIGVGIAYKEHIPTAQKVLLDLVKGDNRFLDNPSPQVVVTDIAESSINLEVMVWLKDSNQEIPISYELRQKIKMALDEAGIQIPFPHRQLFIDAINAEGLKEALSRSPEGEPSGSEGEGR